MSLNTLILLPMKYSIVLIFLLISALLSAQTKREWGLEIKPKAGMLVAHRGVIANIPQEYAQAIEVSLYFNTKGLKNWQYDYKFPIVGVSLFAGKVGNQEILGDFYGSYGFIQLPIIRKPHYALTAKLASGIGYGTKVYDPVTNPKNAAISTHVNALICLGINNIFYFGKNQLSFSADLTHFSNGANKTPNLGLNLPYLGLGYGRLIKQREQYRGEYEEVVYRRRSINLTGIFSRKQIFPSGGKTYSIYAINANYRKIYNAKTGFEAGLDLISKQAILGYKPDIPKTQKDILQFGTYAAYVLPLEDLHFVVGMGIYLRDKYQPEDRFYHRIGMRYEFKNHILVNLTLKSHWAKADYVEWGLGYSF